MLMSAGVFEKIMNLGKFGLDNWPLMAINSNKWWIERWF